MSGVLKQVTLQSPTGSVSVPAWFYDGDGDFSFEIVGEASKQHVLLQLVGGHRPDGKSHEIKFTALVIPEPSNRFDENAMQVLVGGQQVGYLSRPDAKEMKEELSDVGATILVCEALITGGFRQKDAGYGHLGVKLDVLFPLD